MNPNLNEIYADDIDGVLIGYPMAKIRFNSTRGISENGEPIEETVLTVAIPLESLLKACRNIIDNAESDIDMLAKLAEGSVQGLRDSIVKTVPALEKKSRKRLK